jgi:dTMP kinase
MTARFITLEGGEGSGKTTQAERLKRWLEARGITVCLTREPGGTTGAEALRALILHGHEHHFDSMTELLLFMAARRDHVEKVVRPALERGEWVICDRFQDSTAVYQGMAGGVGTEAADAMYRTVIGTLEPDLTLWMDVPPPVGLARAEARQLAKGKDRFESEPLAFHEKLRKAFAARTEASQGRMVRIEANRLPDVVEEAVLAAVRSRFGLA